MNLCGLCTSPKHGIHEYNNLLYAELVNKDFL